MTFLKPNLHKSYESIQKFGYDLFRYNIQDKNPILSPISAYLTLVMAGCGADGTTKAQFLNVLGNDMMALSADMMNLFSDEGVCLNLSIANSTWIDQQFTVNAVWKDTIKSLMGADIFCADITSCETMDNINNWISTKTNGLIDQMLTEPLGPKDRIRLALFNTIYFKGRWENPFRPFNTHKEAFYLSQNGYDKNLFKRHSIQVDMMQDKTAQIEYMSNDFAEGVILYYQINQKKDSAFECYNCNRKHDNKKLGFIAIKPKKNNLIKDVCSRLNGHAIHEMLSNKKWELVDLKLPKFKSTFDINLVESLTKMGLNECFDENRANFSLMGKDTKTEMTLYVSLVMQNAVLTVDEEGTEAAAATELLGCLRGIMPKPPKKMYFNEPFLYMIMDIDRELPLFIGILDNPEI